MVCVGADVVFLVNILVKFVHLFVDMIPQSRYQGVHKADAYNTVPDFQWEMFPFLFRLAQKVIDFFIESNRLMEVCNWLEALFVTLNGNIDNLLAFSSIFKVLWGAALSPARMSGSTMFRGRAVAIFIQSFPMLRSAFFVAFILQLL